jgi:GT2 family glycosyltransferase
MTDPEAPWVRVIIVNYNGGSHTQSAVDALAAQTDRGFEAVIVDNASTDGSGIALTLPDPRFHLVFAPTNLGFAAANNLAARDCTLPWIATLNPDAMPAPDWLAVSRAAIQRYPDVAMFGATLLDAADPSLLDGFGDVFSVFGFPWRGGGGRPLETAPSHDIGVFSPCAAAALYRTSAFDAVGGFDEAYFCYLEDVDLACRLRLRGERCIQLRHAYVLHAGSAISGHDSDFTNYHSYRNRIWFIVKTVPWPLVARVMTLHLLQCIKQLYVAWGGPRFRAIATGLRDGFLDLPRVLRQRRSLQREAVLDAAAFGRLIAWERSQSKARSILILAERSIPDDE